MCGIIGYTGTRQAAPILMDGLASLEYRGYDSAGIAVLDAQARPSVRRCPGKLSGLRQLVDSSRPAGVTGIGHTRWATHGGPTETNAHPHTDCAEEVVVAHNGIVENYIEIRDRLTAQGHRFTSQTDTECIPHLIESFLAQEYSLEEAVRMTAGEIRGAHAVVVTSSREPRKLLAFRLGNAGGIVVGYGDGEMFLASDLPALVAHTRKVAYLAAGEAVAITPEGATYTRLDGRAVKKDTMQTPYDQVSAVKGQFKHFMLKEIYEQPEAVMSSMRGRVDFNTASVVLDEVPFTKAELKDISRIVIIGMGTSLHAAMVARMWLENLARIPTEVDNSSEFRYRDPIIDRHTLVVSISQSGETADTLAAMELAQARGARQLTLCNTEGSQTTRIADGTLLIRAGLEIGVASSKTFTCSLSVLLMLALYLGSQRKAAANGSSRELVTEMARLPQLMGTLLSKNGFYEDLAKKYADYRDFLYLGRGLNFPLAMEGALKLKEISYIHAEGYPAGEMKHGPISLIDSNMPIVALAPRDDLYEKMLSNVSEVKARGGRVLALATEGDEVIAGKADDVVFIPETSPYLYPLLLAVPLQLLAYHIAVRRGCDVDQPRNLAKSVTVE
ncbi:MAG: glutamine--fructose-6-phosphate transaminase (isomerizing) [SAR202 cluster bacterium]|nr:glutamine--fructose-6-phosphate transaminase (isomerizing) [SAR202 cluster bacterium]